MSDTEVHTVLSQVIEFNARKGRAYEKAPGWFRNDGSPVQIVLASFSGFSADAVKLGDRHGAIYWDADRIADFMAQAVLETALTVDKLKGLVTGKLPF